MRMPVFSLQLLDLEQKVEVSTHKWRAQNSLSISITKAMDANTSMYQKQKSLGRVKCLVLSQVCLVLKIALSLHEHFLFNLTACVYKNKTRSVLFSAFTIGP